MSADFRTDVRADFRSTAPMAVAPRSRQWGGFAIGLVAGLLIGLALALGVALYITKAPVPFINKVPQRTAEQDSAETERNRHWDPNAPLGGKQVPRPTVSAEAPATPTSPAAPVAGAASQPPGLVLPPTAAASAAKPLARDPAAILGGAAAPAGTVAPVGTAAPTGAAPAAGAPISPARSTAALLEPFIYFVQAGAFTRNEEAEQQRARLAILGLTAKITEREQAGRTVYRVRMGPYPARDEADSLLAKLQEQGLESQIVRVEKP